MPSKIDDASQLAFLTACMQSVDTNKVDYQKVADEFGIQSAAARMRYKRLKEAMSDKLGGSGKVQKGRVTKSGHQKKQSGKKTGKKEGYEPKWKGMEDDDDDDEEIALSKIAGGKLKKEESEIGEDWKMLPEANASYPVTGLEQQAYGFEHNASMMMPTSLPTYQMPQQMQPQMPSFTTPMQYAYPSPYVALPHTPYYHSGSVDFLSQEFDLQDEQHQNSQRQVTASPHQQNEITEALSTDDVDAGKKNSVDEEASAEGREPDNAQ